MSISEPAVWQGEKDSYIDYLLKMSQSMSVANGKLVQEVGATEARLSKAIDLLKECQASGIDPHSPFGARVAAFLKEVSE